MGKFRILSLANILKSKGQVISYAIILIIAALLLNLGTMVQLGYGKNFEKKWDELKVPDVFVSMMASDYKESFNEYAKGLDGIVNTEVRKGLAVDGAIKYNGSQFSINHMFWNMDDGHRMNRIKVGEKLDKAVEKPIYISYIMKAGGGYNLGDKYVLTAGEKKYTFTVAGFVEDLQYGSPSMGVLGVYLPQKEYEAFAKELGPSAETVSLSWQAVDKEMGKELYTKIVNYCGKDIKGILIGGYYGICKASRTTTANIGALIIAAFSLIIVLVCLLVIHFRISNSIEEDMHNMGALKAIGYTGRQVIISVVLPYIFIGFLSILSGILLSYLVLPVLKAGFDAQTGVLWEQGFNLATMIITFIVILGAVMAVAYGSSRRIRKLQPITALRSGIQIHNFTKNYFPLDKFPGNVNVLLALKGFLANTKQNVLLLLVTVSVTFSALFGGVLYYNISVNSEAFLDAVSGEMPDVSFIIANPENKEKVREKIAKKEGVEQTLYFDYVDIKLKDQSLTAFVTEDFSLLRNDMCYKGRIPIHENEIAIGGLAAKDIGKSIGDTVKLSFGGDEEEYLITGLMQSSNNLGYVCEMTAKGFERLNKAFDPLEIYVYLKKDVSTGKFIKEILAEQGRFIKGNTDFVESTKSQMGTFISISAVIASIILIITAILVTLILYLIIKTLVIRRKQQFGIQKAIGYTTGQLMLQMSFSFMPTILIGALLGGVIGYAGINPMLSALFRGLGIMKIEFYIPLAMTLIITTAISVFAFLAALLVSGRIKHISAYSLIKE